MESLERFKKAEATIRKYDTLDSDEEYPIQGLLVRRLSIWQEVISRHTILTDAECEELRKDLEVMMSDLGVVSANLQAALNIIYR